MIITRDQIPARPKMVAKRVDIVQKSSDITLRLKNHFIVFLPAILFLVLSIPVYDFINNRQTDKYILIPIIYGLGIVLFFIYHKLEQVTLPEIGFSTLTTSTTMFFKLVYIVYPSGLDQTRIVFGLKTFVDQHDEGKILLDYFSSDYSEMVALGSWLAEAIGKITEHAMEFTHIDLQKGEFPWRFVLRYKRKHQKTLDLPQLDLAHPKYDQQKKKRRPYKKIY